MYGYQLKFTLRIAQLKVSFKWSIFELLSKTLTGLCIQCRSLTTQKLFIVILLKDFRYNLIILQQL